MRVAQSSADGPVHWLAHYHGLCTSDKATRSPERDWTPGAGGVAWESSCGEQVPRRRRHPAPARSSPTFVPQARRADSPSGFPRHLAPTVKGFLPFSLPPRSNRRRGKAGPQQREGGEPGQAQAAAASARLLPQPLTPASVRACAALPTRRGRRGRRGAHREASGAGAEPARALGLLVACGHPGGLPSTESGSGNPQPPPTRGRPTASGCGSPGWLAGWLAPGPHAAAGRGKPEGRDSPVSGRAPESGKRSVAQRSSGRRGPLHLPPSVLESSARPAAADLFCSRARARHSPEVPPHAAATAPRLPGQRRGGAGAAAPKGLVWADSSPVAEARGIF